MRRGVAAALAAAAILSGLAAGALADDGPAPAPPPPPAPPSAPAPATAPGPALPFNPVDRAKKADRAKYRLVKVAGATEMAAETYELEVTGRTADQVHVRDTKGGTFRFARGEKGLPARAFLASYLGEDGAAWVEAAKEVEVVADGEATWRVSLRAARVVQDRDGKDRDLVLALSLWIARDGPPPLGLVRATVATTWGDATTGATLELVPEKKEK